jgi:hypothetical protein
VFVVGSGTVLLDRDALDRWSVSRTAGQATVEGKLAGERGEPQPGVCLPAHAVDVCAGESSPNGSSWLGETTIARRRSENPLASSAPLIPEVVGYVDDALHIAVHNTYFRVLD